MRECTLSTNERLAHDVELINAVNSLIMDSPTAMPSDEMMGDVPEATEAEISYEHTSTAKKSNTSDFTCESYGSITLNSVPTDKSSAAVERYNDGDSRICMERRNHWFMMQQSKREKSVAEAAGEDGSSLFFDFENFITEDSRHVESTIVQFQSQLPMSEDLSVVALLKRPITAANTDHSLHLPQQMNSLSATPMNYNSTPIKILNNFNDEKQKTRAATEHTQVPIVQPSLSIVAPRKDIKMCFPCKGSYNYNREDDNDSNSSTSGSSESSSTNDGHNGKAENKQVVTNRNHWRHHKCHHKSIAAPKISPALMHQETDSEDEDNKELWAPEQKRKSERIGCDTVQKIAGKFVIRLKDTKDIVDPPKRPVLPKAMTTRVAKLTRRPIVVKSSTLVFPHVMFYDGDDEDDEVSYPKKLNLVALKNLVPEVRLAPSTIGSSLKRYSQKKDSHFIDVHKISNYKTDLMSYPLVYGAVPRAYSFAAKYFINKYIHLFNSARTRSTTTKVLSTSVGESEKEALHKETSGREEVPLHDGEIEMITYCYWQLTTQDLINWHDDLPRRRLKQILEYAWVLMRDSVAKECKRDKAKKSDLVGVRTSLETVRKYAEFDKPNRLTAACVFMIKEHYDVIVHACGALNLDPYIWETLMRHCGVHHYLCSHTLTEIAKRMPQARNVLKYRLLEIEAQTSDCVVQPMSSKAVFELFSRWITRPSHVTLKLQQAMNNLFFAECRAFGLHVARFGIWKSDVIYAEHVVGYADSRKTMMQVLELPPLSHANIKQAINLVNDTVNSAVANCGGKMHKIKMSIGAVKEFVKYLLYRFSSAIIGVTQCRPISTASAEWVDLFVEAIEDFMNTNSSHVHHVDEWSLTDDCDLDEYDGYGVLKRSFAEIFGDSESDSDYDTTCDEGVHEELKELHREYPDLTEKTRAQPISTSRGVYKTVKRHKLLETEMRYKFSEKKICRTKCVLCFSMTTVQTIYLEPGMRVACCVPCHYALNTDSRVEDEALKRRVRERVKAPIGFTANGMIREFLYLMDETVKTRLSYDRETPNIQPKRQRAKKLTPSQKRKNTDDPVDIVMKRNKEI